ncbi:putative transmembrane ascorbate-dependent reductase [Halotydeus destructor]|nr:putative transmembrane ascorbate-dependent reductase [Halotydeus destructor]
MANYEMRSRAGNRLFDDEDEESTSGCSFGRIISTVIFQILSIGTVVFYTFWVFKHQDGVGWNDRKLLFNLHGLLMVVGMVSIGEAILWYRMFPCMTKMKNKLFHTLLLIAGAAAILVGVVASYRARSMDDEDQSKVHHFTSLHNWMGLSVGAMFVLQFTLGFLSFWVMHMCSFKSLRAAIQPYHAMLGKVIHTLGLATCLVGLNAMAKARLSGQADHDQFDSPSKILNYAGSCLVFLMVIFPFLTK